jgi:predicted ArsR family transcriptional regulator
MTGHADPLDPAALPVVAALGDAQRRRLLGYVRAVRRPVSREEAANAVGVSRKLAAFHLDKLVDAGLLHARFDPSGPRRVGRRPKLYEAADNQVQISLPARRHEVLADILTQALLTEDDHGSAKAAAEYAAHQRGRSAAAAVPRRPRRPMADAERALSVAVGLLADYGFEPDRVSETCVRLRNCPFHPIAQSAPALICQLNQAFITGVLEVLAANTVDAVLAPEAGECCVELRAEPTGR